MSIPLNQYRAVIGAFYLISFSVRFLFRDKISGWWNGLRFITFIILLCGDVHPNPGPETNTSLCNLNFVHVNLNSITVYPKLDELKLLSQYHKVDILAISESWLSPDISDESIHIPNFNTPIRKDRPYRGGGVAIYVNEM